MLPLVLAYAHAYGFFKDKFNINLPGFGFVLRFLKTDFVLEVMGHKMFFNHNIASSYGRHISGQWNEPETHLFLGNLILELPDPVNFIDIGANIGEMVIDVAKYAPHLSKILAFEPIPDCCYAIKKSLELNDFHNYQIFQNLVGEKNQLVKFEISKSVAGSSVYSKNSQESDSQIEMVTLDSKAVLVEGSVIILIDVEGYEPNVIRGGHNLIKKIKPLIIFEYNLVSKQHFNIKDISLILGDEYKIYRLRADGKLDGDLEHAWNCVAIPTKSSFDLILNKYII